MEVLDRPFDSAAHHHCASLSADLVQGQYLLVEMVHHDFGLETDRVIVALDILPQFLACAFGIELWVRLNLFHKLVEAIHGRIALEHVTNESLVYCLLHRIAVEWQVLDLAFRSWQRIAKHLQCLVLRRCSECKVAGIGQHLSGVHPFLKRVVDLVFWIR